MAMLHSIATADALLLTCLLLTVRPVVAALESIRCTSSRVSCQLRADTINCSQDVRASLTAKSDIAVFVQDAPSDQPSRVSLLPLSSLPKDRVLSVARLDDLAACFLLTYDVSLRLLVADGVEFRLLPGSLDAFDRVRRLTLKLRLYQERIPASIFTARLSNLRNLQLEFYRVTQIEPGAFQELRLLQRLSISNLELPYLNSTVLQGLDQLRVLELQNNSLTKLDAASFSASPRLETLDLRRWSMEEPVDVAPGTFCGLRELRQLQCSASLGLNCSHFSSQKLHLRLSHGSVSWTRICERLLGQKSPCRGGTAGMAAVSTPTAAGKRFNLSTTSTSGATSITTATTVRKPTTAAKTMPTSIARTTTATGTLPTAASIAIASSAASRLATPAAAAAAAAAASSVSSGSVLAASLVAMALVLLAVAGGFTAFAVTRRRLGGVTGILHRAPSRQPIFSPEATVDVEIDMQDSLHWNPVYQGAAAAAPTSDVA